MVSSKHLRHESTGSLVQIHERTLSFMERIRMRGTIPMERGSQESALRNFWEVPQQSTSLNSKSSLIQRLRRGRNARARFVDSNVSKTIAFQTRSLRDKEGWSQQRLAEEIGSNQNAIYRAENP